MKDYNLRLLFEEAKTRFEHVVDEDISFSVYSNSYETCYTFTACSERFIIGLSLSNSSWHVNTNITTTALLMDVKFFFNLIYPACSKLPHEEP